jgi:hypothetical protein
MDETETEYVAGWAEVFSEIGYAYERQYPPKLYINTKGIKVANFYKLSISEDGEMEYKGNVTRFDTSCWWKVELLVKLFEGGGALETLYGQASS